MKETNNGTIPVLSGSYSDRPMPTGKYPGWATNQEKWGVSEVQLALFKQWYHLSIANTFGSNITMLIILISQYCVHILVTNGMFWSSNLPFDCCLIFWYKILILVIYGSYNKNELHALLLFRSCMKNEIKDVQEIYTLYARNLVYYTA